MPSLFTVNLARFTQLCNLLRFGDFPVGLCIPQRFYVEHYALTLLGSYFNPLNVAPLAFFGTIDLGILGANLGEFSWYVGDKL